MKAGWMQLLRSLRGQSASECVAILGVTVLVLAASVHPFNSRMPGLFACYGSAGAAAQIPRLTAPLTFRQPDLLAAVKNQNSFRQDDASSGDDFLHLRA